MDGVTLQPAAGSQGELAGILMIRAHHVQQGRPRKHVLIPDSAHGTNPASATIAGYDVISIPSDKSGRIDSQALAREMNEDVACLMHRSHHVQLVQMYRNSSHLVQCVHPSALALPKDSECTSVGLLNTVGSPSPGRRSVGSPGRGRHPIAGSERGVLVPVRAAVRRSGFARCPLAGTRQDVPGQPVMPRARHGAHAGACRTRPRHSSPWSGHFPVVLVLALEPGHFRPGRTIDTATTPGSSLRFSGSRCAHSASDCRSPDSLRWPG